jgi:hypothetical protein
MNIPKKYLTETVILIEKVHKVNTNQVLAVLTQHQPANKDDPNYEYFQKLVNWAETNRERIENNGGVNLSELNTKVNAKLDISDRSLINNKKLENHYNTIVGVLDKLWQLMSNEGKFGQNAEISKLIQQTTLEILAGLSGIKNPKPEKNPKDTEVEDPKGKEPEEEPKEEENFSANGNRDWTKYKATKLAGAAGKPTSEILEEFYNEYYKIEFAGLKSYKEEDSQGIVTKLKSLNKALIPEFNKLGYNPETNPFVQFLKILIKYKKKEIFDKLTINNYGAIHNAYIDRIIPGNTLGNYNDRTKKTILFCEDLYNHNGPDIIDYLSLQKSVIDEAKKDSRYSNDPELIVAKLFIQQDIKLPTDKPIGYKEKVKELLKPEVTIALPSDSDTKMRSWLEISEMFQHIFGVTAKKTIHTADIESIVDQVESQGIILGMLKHLLEQDSFIRDYPEKVEELEMWLKSQPEHPTEKDSIESKKLLSKYSLKSDNILTLAKKLVAAAKKDGAKN